MAKVLITGNEALAEAAVRAGCRSYIGYPINIRPRQMEAVREYLERTWPNQFVQLDPAYAVEHGLFGPGAVHSRLLERLGDLLVPAPWGGVSLVGNQGERAARTARRTIRGGNAGAPVGSKIMIWLDI